MISLLRSGRRLASAIRRRFYTVRQVRHVDGVPLPPASLRYCGAAFHDDDTFVDSGRTEAHRLTTDFGVGPESTLLEIGCGPGRLPIGLIAQSVRIARYDGVDIDAASISWCKRHISKANPAYHFHRIDARHDRYKPKGRPMTDQFVLPFADGAFDLVYLHSVFANMLPADIQIYCGEFSRLLKPNGSVFLTAFVEEGVPAVTVNPDDYHLASSGRLNIARFEKSFFFDLITQGDLTVDAFDHASDLGGQSTVHLRRAAQA